MVLDGQCSSENLAVKRPEEESGAIGRWSVDWLVEADEFCAAKKEKKARLCWLGAAVM